MKTSWRRGWCMLTDLRNFQHYKIQISVTMPFAYRVYIVKEVRYEIISNENSYYFFLIISVVFPMALSYMLVDPAFFFRLVSLPAFGFHCYLFP